MITSSISSRRLAIVASALPPCLDGIGDHTSGLAGSLSGSFDVTVHTARGFSPDAIAGVKIEQSFDVSPRRAIVGLAEAVGQTQPVWIILQYNPFCFGHRGFNPFLAGTMKKIRRASPATQLAVMVHEMYMPMGGIKNTIMSLYQRQQFSAVTSQANITLFSTGPWVDRYRLQFPDRTCMHMPVGSNLPFVPTDRQAIRRALGIDAATIVLGSFGGNHPSRLFGLLAKAARRLKQTGRDVRILSIGSAGPAIREAVPELPIIDLGSLSARDVSKNLQAIDIYASPFFDGVSTRRGSFFAGIQHGLATVTTRSYHSDRDMLAFADKAFLAPDTSDESGFVSAVEQLAGDENLRQSIGHAAQICFDENYSQPVLAEKWKMILQVSGSRSDANQNLHYRDSAARG